MRRLAIYAHFDPDNEVKRYVLHTLGELGRDCERLDFVSTSPLPAAEQGKLRGSCASVTLKDNVGYDFGMWQRALAETDLEAWDEIVLANSSVFGPVFPMSSAYERAGSADFWGMTDNHDIAWHLQSYFLVFRRPVLRSAAFRQFWQSVLPYRDKFQAIRAYEVGLTRFLREAGFRARALYPVRSLFPPWPLRGLYRKPDDNATCYHPLRLLRAGMPLVKVQLLRDNPVDVRLGPVVRYLERTGYDLSLIDFLLPARR
ncbi:MAG: hypothetical protein IT373_37010 [Polyangiaceae bacterium]|nr:hypothetical protein [Polyangiaceae bacterium]